jgi:hypothetical protein
MIILGAYCIIEEKRDVMCVEIFKGGVALNDLHSTSNSLIAN